MENIRTLRYTQDSNLEDDIKKHYLKRENHNLVNIGNISNKKEKILDNNIKYDENDEEYKKISLLDKIKYKTALKVFGALGVLAIVLGYNYLPLAVKESKISNWIKSEYLKDYEKMQVIEKAEDIVNICYLKINKIIPEKMYEVVVDKYLNCVKPRITNFDLAKITSFSLKNNIENTVAVFNPSDINISSDEIVLAEESITTSSQISQMDLDVSEIKNKNISIDLPVSGTVTSIYGAREEVFKNVGYHTGVDIANVLDTPVKSATTGKVVLTQSMDKYYGNNIEIETNGVIFKYAHLNKINVSEGQEISQGDIIGLMGSTGASTGSHLHFEIKINGRTVDPELLIKVR